MARLGSWGKRLFGAEASAAAGGGGAPRRHDVDAVRAIALLLLLVYHVAVSYIFFTDPMPPPAGNEWVASGKDINGLWIALQSLNIWRIPILFLVAGVATRFSMERRSMGRLVRERGWRLGLPLVFGYFLVSPLFFLFADLYYGREAVYLPDVLHLWFLPLMLLYVVLLAPVLYYLKARPGNLLFRIAGRMMRWPLGLGLLLMLGLPLVVSAVAFNHEDYSGFFRAWVLVETAVFAPGELAGDWWRELNGASVGLICFLAGYLFASRQDELWASLRRGWPLLLPLALLLFLVRLVLFETEGEWVLTVRNGLIGVESAAWMLSALGLGAQFLNRRSRVFGYLTVAVFPVYILHFPAQNGVAALLFPLGLPSYVEYLAVLLLVAAVSFGLFELVRRVPKVRVVFGLKP